jgi:hypothetical protein
MSHRAPPSRWPRRAALTALLLAALVTSAEPAAGGSGPRPPPGHIQGPHPGERREPPRSAAVAVSPGRAAAIAATRTGGRVLDVQLQGGQRPRYRVRILVGGQRVRTVTVDAVTGEFRG